MDKQKLIMLVGLPGSGKTYWAKKEAEKEGVTRINMDDLRSMMHNSKWTKSNEKLMQKLRLMMVRTALSEGQNVIVDDTNFAPKHETQIKMISVEFNADFEVKYFDTDLEICLERNANKANPVPENVIWRMYTDYVLPRIQKENEFTTTFKREKAILIDIDGTAAIMSDRSPYNYDKVYDDEVNHSVQEIVLSSDKQIIFLSGRDSVCREETTRWLNEKFFADEKRDYELFMRKEGDNRKDSIVKRELYEDNVQENWDIIFCLEDRFQMIILWRELGLNCFEVNYGHF